MLEYMEEDWKSRFVLSPVSVVLHICSPSRAYFRATLINVSRLARVVLMFSQPNFPKLCYDYIVLLKAITEKKNRLCLNDFIIAVVRCSSGTTDRQISSDFQGLCRELLVKTRECSEMLFSS